PHDIAVVIRMVMTGATDLMSVISRPSRGESTSERRCVLFGGRRLARRQPKAPAAVQPLADRLAPLEQERHLELRITVLVGQQHGHLADDRKVTLAGRALEQPLHNLLARDPEHGERQRCSLVVWAGELAKKVL